MIIAVFANVLGDEEQDVEKGRQRGIAGVVRIEPKLQRINLPVTGKGRPRGRLAEQDVGPPHVGPPPGRVGPLAEGLVSVFNSLVVFFFVRILLGAAQRIAALPEILHELVTVVIRRKLEKLLALLVGDNVNHVVVQPVGVSFGERGALVSR